MPKLVKDIRTYNSNKLKELKDRWQYNFLTDDTIYEYIKSEEFPKNYSSLIKQHKADWIRVCLLKKYGGCWMDASIIINNPNELENLYNKSVEKKSQFTGFTYGNKKTNTGIPSYIENWFIISPKRSSLISLLYSEFTDAIEMELINYKKKIINEEVDISALTGGYGINDDNIYHTMHACIQYIIQKKDTNISMVLMRAEDSMFKVHDGCGYNDECIMNTIKDKKNEVKNIPYIKLTNGSRSKNIDISNYFE
jgi:hypothetical protein